MAEQVQSILERMVPFLKDLRNRQIFSSEEIRSIVERRRRFEYLLQRRSESQMSDYLRYIEDELQLERLRKLRKEKVLTMMQNEERLKKRNRSHEDDRHDNQNHLQQQSSYQTSGPGDAHIISHIHFLYQRTLKKFHYPIDILLNYANFSKECKSFHMLSRVYAMGLQHHPREAGLWIEAASFEYFGYVAQDYENSSSNSRSSKVGDEKEDGRKGDGGLVSKVVGSSIKNARVLMQRGLRINKTSSDLWLQYFALELHYVQKLRGRKEILDGMGKLNRNHDSDDENEDVTDKEEEGEDRMVVGAGKGGASERGSTPTTITTDLLPCQVIFKNAILAIANDVQFRLQFVRACRLFPQTESLETYIMTSIAQDFGTTSVEAWVAQISYAEEQMKNNSTENEKSCVEGFLGRKYDDRKSSDGEGNDVRPMKKARVEDELGCKSSSRDSALVLLQEALDAEPNPKIYLEGARFLRMRIQRLFDYIADSDMNEKNIDDDDVSYLLKKGEDAKEAAQRHTNLLDELYESSKTKNVSSTALTLEYVDFLMSVDQPRKAENLLSIAVTSMPDADSRLWLRWAEISRQLEAEAPGVTAPSTSSICILRRALKHTPLYDRYDHTLILTELMQSLMIQPSSEKTIKELKLLFQKLILLSQGLSYSSSSTKKKEVEDGVDVEEKFGGTVSVASTVLAFLNYTLLNNAGGEDSESNSVRSIYTSLLFHSNYGKSSRGKTQEELCDMKSFFDACIRYEMDDRQISSNTSAANKNKTKYKKNEKMARKMRLCKLYTASIGFFSSGGGISSIMWRDAVNDYQRKLDDVKCSL